MDILRFDDLPQGGFAGLREKRFVADRRLFGRHKSPETSEGIGNFVYLADANFLPNGETGLHPHHEVDVISVMVEGRIKHAGSMQDGQSLEAGTVQVQRAGGEGFTHNEINPDPIGNHMIQVWVLPEKPGEPAGYKLYQPKLGSRVHVYGGAPDQSETFDSRTSVSIAWTTAGQIVTHPGEVMAFLSKGEGIANGTTIGARTRLRTSNLEFTAGTDAHLILIHLEG